MDKQARDNAYRAFSQESASIPGDKYAFKKGFDTGYKSACGDWVRIETTDDLPKVSGNPDLVAKARQVLANCDWYDENGEWRTDGVPDEDLVIATMIHFVKLLYSPNPGGTARR